MNCTLYRHNVIADQTSFYRFSFKVHLSKHETREHLNNCWQAEFSGRQDKGPLNKISAWCTIVKRLWRNTPTNRGIIFYKQGKFCHSLIMWELHSQHRSSMEFSSCRRRWFLGVVVFSHLQFIVKKKKTNQFWHSPCNHTPKFQKHLCIWKSYINFISICRYLYM
jgi:hypothetical protein